MPQHCFPRKLHWFIQEPTRDNGIKGHTVPVCFFASVTLITLCELRQWAGHAAKTGVSHVLYSWLDRPFNHPPRSFQAPAEMFHWLLQPNHIMMERVQQGMRWILRSVLCAISRFLLKCCPSLSVIYNTSCADSGCQEAGFSIMSNRDDGTAFTCPKTGDESDDRPQSTWTLVSRRLIAFHVQLWLCISVTQAW